jgi:hypothetical protein
MTTPGGCIDATNCAWGIDTFQERWSHIISITNAFSADGEVNMSKFLDITQYPAAQFCDNLEFWGFTNWYLPSRIELNHVFMHKTAIGWFADDVYWTSTEDSRVDYNWWHAFPLHSNWPNIGNSYYKPNLYLIRCIRKN